MRTHRHVMGFHPTRLIMFLGGNGVLWGLFRKYIRIKGGAAAYEFPAMVFIQKRLEKLGRKKWGEKVAIFLIPC